ncbi:MAG TPA: T9SS type A sorting domain-containing protein, partial [Bacteroidetes bacterium]|nr:T9SS type A sorting domain-containing protein [Bacteroidota bacterium]HEX05574.1 T9SS type A sorting domain-containing protein [Bacteroidota bacterium]
PGTVEFTDLPQSVPAYAPGGVYTYTAYIGLLPGIVGAQDSFTFTKIGTDPNGGGSWYDETWATAMQTASSTASTVKLPTEFGLGEAYPNPFNPSTSIKLFLPVAAEVTVQVFNVMGQEVKTLVNGQLEAGSHTLTVEAEGLSSGIYFVRATSAGKLNEMRKITLIR